MRRVLCVLAVLLAARTPMWAQNAETARGTQFYSGVSLVKQDTTVAGVLFLPEKVSRVRAVIVVVRYGLGFQLEESPLWGKLAQDTGCGFLVVQFSNIGPSDQHSLRAASAHRDGLVPGFTSKYRICRLVHWEVFGDIRDAIAREKEIKAWRREKKLWLIQFRNPVWEDLSGGKQIPHRRPQKSGRA
jgi:predicted GIY-YIG superfamily endonuclease